MEEWHCLLQLRNAIIILVFAQLLLSNTNVVIVVEGYK